MDDAARKILAKYLEDMHSLESHGLQPIRRQLSEVLSRPEFSPDESLTWWGWLGDLIVRFFRWLGTLYTVNPALFWVLVVGLTGLLVLMIALIVLQVRSAFALGGRRRKDDESVAERARRSRTYRAEADRAAEAGDYTEAVRYLFLSLVYRLDESGRVSFQTAYTNREYLALLDGRLAARDRMRVFVDTLDDDWYGQHATGRPRYEQCLTLYEQLA